MARLMDMRRFAVDRPDARLCFAHHASRPPPRWLDRFVRRLYVGSRQIGAKSRSTTLAGVLRRSGAADCTTELAQVCMPTSSPNFSPDDHFCA